MSFAESILREYCEGKKIWKIDDISTIWYTEKEWKEHKIKYKFNKKTKNVNCSNEPICSLDKVKHKKFYQDIVDCLNLCELMGNSGGD